MVLTAHTQDELFSPLEKPLEANINRGVLLALRNAASYYQGGKVVNVAGPELMAQAKPYPIYPGFALVAYPNRDSTPYKERYVTYSFQVFTSILVA